MYLNKNPNPSLKVANGAKSIMHSLHYSNGIPKEIIAKIRKAKSEMNSGNYRNAVIEVPIPDAVLLEIENERLGNILYPTKLITRYFKTMLPGKQTFGVKRHDFQAGFSYTFYKCQGLTINRLVMVAYERPGKMFKFLKMELRDFYVALSRVRKRSHFRLLGTGREGTMHSRFKHLLKLTPCPDLID